MYSRSLCRFVKFTNVLSLNSHKFVRTVAPKTPISTDDVTNNQQSNQSLDNFSHPPASTITGINEGADLSNFLYPPTFNTRELRIAKKLETLLFSPQDVRKIVLYFRDRNSIYTVDPTAIKPTFDFWIQSVKPPKERNIDDHSEESVPSSDIPSQQKFYQISTKSTTDKLRSGDEVEEENDTFEYDYRKTEVRTILAKNPILLLANPQAMNRRLARLNDLGILSGKNDIWTIFHFAPVAFFLQDWAEFLRKFYYVQFRIMEWLVDRRRDPFPTPHPAIKYARIFDLPYHVIKARFEFAIKSGLKSPTILSKIKPEAKTLELGDLLLSPLPLFLKVVTPGLNEEEYNLYEKYIEEKDDPEDRMIEEMAKLEANANYEVWKMDKDVAKKIAGKMLDQELNFSREPLESLTNIKTKPMYEENEEVQEDVLRALKDELLLKRQLIGKKRAKLTKQKDLERLRLIFPGTKPYPEKDDDKVDKGPMMELRLKKD